MVDIRIGKIRIRNLEIFTFFILVIIYLLVAFIQEGSLIYNWVANISTTIRNMAEGSTNALLVAFLISLGGNSSVLIIIPYALVIYLLSIQNPGSWYWIALVSGVGGALGEVVSYYVGRLISKSKKMKESEIGEKFHRMKIQFEKNPRTVPWTVFFFALTPLPDDIILVPLGMMEYDYKRTIFPCMIGKVMLCTIICLLGYFVGTLPNFMELLVAEYPIAEVLYLVIPSEDVNPRADLISFSFIFIFIYLVVRINFEGISKRQSKERKLFQAKILEGFSYPFDELISTFDIVKPESFREYISGMAEKYENFTFKNNILRLDSIVNKKMAYVQSMDFISYFYLSDSTDVNTPDVLSNEN